MVDKALNADESHHETDRDGYSREALPSEADFIYAYATAPGSVPVASLTVASLTLIPPFPSHYFHLPLSLPFPTSGMCHGVTRSTVRGSLRLLWTP